MPVHSIDEAFREGSIPGSCYRAVRGIEAGDEVIVEGTLPEVSICMQGTTIQVVRIEEESAQNP